jgi:hypothetical protein
MLRKTTMWRRPANQTKLASFITASKAGHGRQDERWLDMNPIYLLFNCNPAYLTDALKCLVPYYRASDTLVAVPVRDMGHATHVLATLGMNPRVLAGADRVGMIFSDGRVRETSFPIPSSFNSVDGNLVADSIGQCRVVNLAA